MASGTELRLCRMAAAPYPAYNPKSPLAQGLLKLPVPGGTGGGGDWPPPVRSQRHE
ncbi:hypothetical protein [Klebsiella pneumoniae]|uniref:hypothetical protein n=1 Tax=Klebsiella pneumoniae TaxID=573 RepID=UPI0013DDF695|nr:hypothetical protein [Klebsiella pneumoniae]